MRELLSIVLRRDGYEVAGRRGRPRPRSSSSSRQRVDILITDIRMPEMNGVDVLREAKQHRPGNHQHRHDRVCLRPTRRSRRCGSARPTTSNKSPNAASELRLPGRARSSNASGCSRKTCCSSGRCKTTAPVLEHHRQQRRDAGGLPAGRDDRADRQHGADHRRVRHRQGARRARDPLQLAAQASGRSSRSTAARCPRRCSTRSCSATCAARSPAPTATRRGSSRSPRRARSSSTRSAR